MTQSDQSNSVADEAAVPRETERFLDVTQWVRGRTGTRYWVLCFYCIFSLKHRDDNSLSWRKYLDITPWENHRREPRGLRTDHSGLQAFQSSSVSVLKKQTCMRLKTAGSFRMEHMKSYVLQAQGPNLDTCQFQRSLSILFFFSFISLLCRVFWASASHPTLLPVSFN